MQKRVAIARAIVLNPKYLFCDEPNSGLDPQTSLVIDEFIHGITQEYEMTTIVNTHDMNSVMGIGENIILQGSRGVAGQQGRDYDEHQRAAQLLHLRQRPLPLGQGGQPGIRRWPSPYPIGRRHLSHTPHLSPTSEKAIETAEHQAQGVRARARRCLHPASSSPLRLSQDGKQEALRGRFSPRSASCFWHLSLLFTAPAPREHHFC